MSGPLYGSVSLREKGREMADPIAVEGSACCDSAVLKSEVPMGGAARPVHVTETRWTAGYIRQLTHRSRRSRLRLDWHLALSCCIYICGVIPGDSALQ